MVNKKGDCFIIMPISDHSDYREGHFFRVYEHLIVPACELAGFKAIRADDVINTNYIAIDVIRKIIESEMAICDLSSQNPNVLYELGIRQAFNKPIALIKDSITKRIFDIQGFRDFEYDENLRVDKVEEQIEKLSRIITSTYEQDGSDINSLISLLSLSPAKIDTSTTISKDTELILNSLSILDKRISKIEENKSSRIVDHPSPKFYGGGTIPPPPPKDIPNDVGDFLTLNDFDNLEIGDKVYHQKFGYGLVAGKAVEGAEQKIDVDFISSSTKRLLFKLANLRKVL